MLASNCTTSRLVEKHACYPCVLKTCHRSVPGGKLLTTESMPLESWRQVLRSACKHRFSTSPVSGSWSQFCRCGCRSNTKAVTRVTGHKPPASGAARNFLKSRCIDRGILLEHRNCGLPLYLARRGILALP